jgi:hypothetical protein
MADGGKAPTFEENTSEALAKPYVLTWPLSAEQVANLDEMLVTLFDVNRENEEAVADVVEEVEVLQAAPAPADQILISVTIPITEAEIESANSSPVVLVAAIAGQVLVPVTALVVVTVTSVYTSSPTWGLRHGGIAGNLSGTVAPSLNINGTKRFMLGAADNFTFSGDPTGASIVLFLNANPTGGATGVATAKVHLTYYVADSITTVA